MIKLAKLTDYATVILSVMAKNPADVHTALEMTECTGIAQPTVSKILKLLVKAKVLNSVRGAKGGYLLARAPEKISIASVIQALEGPIALTECTVSHKNCEVTKACHIQGNWGLINQKIANALESVSLADLILPAKPPEEIYIPVNRLFK